MLAGPNSAHALLITATLMRVDQLTVAMANANADADELVRDGFATWRDGGLVPTPSGYTFAAALCGRTKREES